MLAATKETHNYLRIVLAETMENLLAMVGLMEIHMSLNLYLMEKAENLVIHS